MMEQIWPEIEGGSTSGQTTIHIFRKLTGPIGYAKRYIMRGKVITAFYLFTGNRIMVVH